MEWLLKFAEKNEDEKVKIVFHGIKFFIVSTFSFILYRFLFGSFEIIEFTFKNVVEFINSKYLYFSALSFAGTWFLYWITNEIEKKIATIYSNKLKAILNNRLIGKFTCRNVKTLIKFSNFLIRIKIVKLQNNKIYFSEQIIASLTNSKDKKDESEHTFFIMSVCMIFLGVEFYYYTEVYMILVLFFLISLILFMFAMTFLFSIKNNNMVLAILKSIKIFTERHEFNRDNKQLS